MTLLIIVATFVGFYLGVALMAVMSMTCSTTFGE